MVPAGGEYWTALQAALDGGHLEIVKLLLANGVDPNAQGVFFVLPIPQIQAELIHAGGRYGTALQTAANRGYLEVVKQLVEKGADLNFQGAVLFLISKIYADLIPAGGKYGTALHAALVGGNFEIVAILLEMGADPNVQGASLVIPRVCDEHVTCRRCIRHGTPNSSGPAKFEP
jgi:ankyrin repeat protein